MNELTGSILCGISCIFISILAVIAVVVIFILNSKRSREKAIINPNWPTVTGKIVNSEFDVDDEGIISPVISFEYTINGQVYVAQQVVGKPNSLKSVALKTLSLYPLESDIVVYFNPEDPKDAHVLKK